MSKNVLLSVCIPTYNRSNCLKQCLDSIINQEWFDENSIEIVISDNASTDNTTELVKTYQEKYKNIIYIRNNENLWFDRNLDNAITNANWKYCLIIWDDDWFFEWALIKVLNILKTNNNSFYISNSWWFDIKLKEKITLSPNLNFKDELTNYKKLSDFIISLSNKPIHTVWYFWWMSWQIFLREKWNNCEKKESYIWSLVIHLHTLLDIMKNEKFWIIWTPIIKARADNVRWDLSWMNTAIKRELMTLNTFKWIANKYNIKYSKIKLYTVFIINYNKNFLISFIKKYILKDSKQIYKIKLFLNNIYKRKNEK